MEPSSAQHQDLLLCVGGTEEALPEYHKKTSSGLLLHVSDQIMIIRVLEHDMRAWLPVMRPVFKLVSFSLIGICQRNPRTGRSAISTLFYSQMTTGSHWADVTDGKESGDGVPIIMLPAISFNLSDQSKHNLGGSHRSPCVSTSTLTAVMHGDENLRFTVRPYAGTMSPGFS